MSFSITEKLLILGKKGYTFRLLMLNNQYENPEKNITFRIKESELNKYNLGSGALITVKSTCLPSNNLLIDKLELVGVVGGDTKKQRVLVISENYKIGDLIDEIPIMRFGKPFSQSGKNVRYAYFNYWL